MKFRELGCLILLVVIFSAGYVLAADSNSVAVLSQLAQRMQKPVSIDFRNTPIEDVIRSLADQSDVDIVKSPKVTGNVTATLTEIPLEEALQNILAAHGFGYIASNSMIRIVPLEEMSEISERLVSRIYRINYASVKDVKDSLKDFISPRGSLSCNVGTSNIIVTDSESKIKAMDTFVEEVDRITPQIEVEARIYDITSKDRLDIGVQWQAGSNTTINSALGSNPTAGDMSRYSTGTFSSATTKTESTTGTLRFGWLNSGIDLDVILRAQQENLDAKLLANPRILVLDNEKANIKIISEIPYQELTETSGGGSIGTVAFREVGVELEVTPHLTREKMIRLILAPKFSVQNGSVYVGSGDDARFSQPIVDRREAQTTLLIEDRQTVVLGGLRKKDVNKQVNKIPLLGDLPIAGAVFKCEGESTTTSELVVFVTPTLVEKPVLSDLAKQQLQTTEFNGPSPFETKAEKPKQEKVKKVKTAKIKKQK
jgi:type IV pilus assembly protein PilQ